MYLRNVGPHTGYTALYPRRPAILLTTATWTWNLPCRVFSNQWECPFPLSLQDNGVGGTRLDLRSHDTRCWSALTSGNFSWCFCITLSILRSVTSHSVGEPRLRTVCRTIQNSCSPYLVRENCIKQRRLGMLEGNCASDCQLLVNC
jgi:hypothetical protein